MIGAEVAARLPLLRQQAESLMVDTCTITRSAGNGTLNTTTGQYTPPTPTTVYTGKCRVKANSRFDHVIQFGEQPVSLYRFTVSIPMSATTVLVDDIITINTSALDPAMPNLRLRVREPEFGSQVTARRIGCELNAG